MLHAIAIFVGLLLPTAFSAVPLWWLVTLLYGWGLWPLGVLVMLFAVGASLTTLVGLVAVVRTALGNFD